MAGACLGVRDIGSLDLAPTWAGCGFARVARDPLSSVRRAVVTAPNYLAVTNALLNAGHDCPRDCMLLIGCPVLRRAVQRGGLVEPT